MYLIELNSGGVRSLAWIIGADKEGQAAERQALVVGNPGLLKLMPTLSGRETIIMRVYELTRLRRIRDGSRAMNIIDPPWMADPISKSLGPRLGEFISLYRDGVIHPRRYDEHDEKLPSSTS